MSHQLREQIDAALSDVTAAEQELATVLSELRSGARAEKTTITTAVENAFSRLRKSREELAKLRELIDDK